ncbi:MAG TPA: TolC family protein [Spirochaetota bacterium]|nr:TolC family protein [Spirochaetota bacterium]
MNRTALSAFVCAAVLCTFGPHAVNAEDRVNAMVLEASGVTDDDIKAAESKKAVSLFDAFALSVRNTEALPIIGENVIQSRSVRNQAIGAYLPKVSLNAARPIPDNNPPSGATGSLPSKTYAYIYARQPIITGLNELSGIELASKSESISRNTLALTAQQQFLLISQKYYLVCQLQETLKTDRDIIDLYRKNRGELVRRVSVGKNRQNDVLSTDAQIARLDAQIISITSQLETARNDLISSAGLRADTDIAGGIDLPPPSFTPDDTRTAAYKRYEVLIAQQNVELAGINLKAAWGGHLPTVYLEGNYRLYNESKVDADKFYAAITASLPIFNGGITQEKVSQAESMKRQANLNLSQTVRTVEESIRTSYDTWNSAVKQSDAYKRALESAERNYNVTMNDYRLNLVTILEVITALTNLQQARNDYSAALLSAGLARIHLGTSIGEFPGGGNSVLRNAPLIKTGDAR